MDTERSHIGSFIQGIPVGGCIHEMGFCSRVPKRLHMSNVRPELNGCKGIQKVNCDPIVMIICAYSWQGCEFHWATLAQESIPLAVGGLPVRSLSQSKIQSLSPIASDELVGALHGSRSLLVRECECGNEKHHMYSSSKKALYKRRPFSIRGRCPCVCGLGVLSVLSVWECVRSSRAEEVLEYAFQRSASARSATAMHRHGNRLPSTH